MSLIQERWNPKTLFTSLIVATALFSSAHAVSNDEQFEIGKQKAKVCMTCHGEDGISTQEPYPNLRGQKMGYLISSLKDYPNSRTYQWTCRFDAATSRCSFRPRH